MISQPVDDSQDADLTALARHAEGAVSVVCWRGTLGLVGRRQLAGKMRAKNAAVFSPVIPDCSDMRAG